MSQDIKIEVIKGVEDNCLVINDRRVSGPKPWGGGKVIMSFDVKQSEIMAILPALSRLEDVEKEIKTLQLEQMDYHGKIMLKDKEIATLKEQNKELLETAQYKIQELSVLSDRAVDLKIKLEAVQASLKAVKKVDWKEVLRKATPLGLEKNFHYKYAQEITKRIKEATGE